MNLYKCAFPYVLAASALVLPSCSKNVDVFSYKVVVTGARDAITYIDVNNDGRYDKTMCLAVDKKELNSWNVIRNNMTVGDVLTLRTTQRDFNRKHFAILLNQLDSVNDKSREELVAFYKKRECTEMFEKKADFVQKHNKLNQNIK